MYLATRQADSQSERYQVRNAVYPRLDTAAASAGNEDASASREAGPNKSDLFWDIRV
jgi:hypothetical protein